MSHDNLARLIEKSFLPTDDQHVFVIAQQEAEKILIALTEKFFKDAQYFCSVRDKAVSHNWCSGSQVSTGYISNKTVRAVNSELNSRLMQLHLMAALSM